MLVKMACPGCGKPLSISGGTTHTCTRCGTKVTCDSNGKIIGKEIRRK